MKICEHCGSEVPDWKISCCGEIHFEEIEEGEQTELEEWLTENCPKVAEGE